MQWQLPQAGVWPPSSNPATRTQDGMSPLYMASQNGHLEVVQLLLDHEGDVNQAMQVNHKQSGTQETGETKRNKTRLCERYENACFRRFLYEGGAYTHLTPGKHLFESNNTYLYMYTRDVV